MKVDVREPSLSEAPPGLVRDALDALFDIAWEGAPPEVTGSVRREIEALPDEAAQALLSEMVDTEVLARLVELARQGELPESTDPPLDADRHPFVDDALDPLVQLVGGEEASRAIAGLDPTQRARILFAAVNSVELAPTP